MRTPGLEPGWVAPPVPNADSRGMAGHRSRGRDWAGRVGTSDSGAPVRTTGNRAIERTPQPVSTWASRMVDLVCSGFPAGMRDLFSKPRGDATTRQTTTADVCPQRSFVRRITPSADRRGVDECADATEILVNPKSREFARTRRRCCQCHTGRGTTVVRMWPRCERSTRPAKRSSGQGQYFATGCATACASSRARRW
jgi:hypothetical protein